MRHGFLPASGVLLIAMVLPACTPTADTAPSAARQGRTEAWMNEVAARLRDGQHAFRPDGAGFRAQVPARGLRGRFDADGARIRVQDDDVGVRVLGVGRSGGIEPWAATPSLGACVPGMADPTGACIPRLEYAGGGVTEWWVARPDGFEQGWTVEIAPDGAGPLEVHLAVTDAAARLGDGEVWIDGDLGAQLLVSGLAAWDADGRPLDVRFAALDGGFRVVVDDTDARYPVEIDPIYSTAGWSIEGTHGNEPIGASVAGVGDVNGDGYDDVAVGAPSAFDGVGGVWVHLGSAAGLASTASVILHVAGAHTDFGYGVAGAGDVNRDGYDDIVVGAYGSASRAYVFHGAADGPAETPATTLSTSGSGEDFGYAVDGLGDVNGDGYDDVAVGAPTYGTSTGRVYVFHGGASGVSSTAARTLTGSGTSLYFGKAVAGAGDVNGDGYADLAVGAPRYSSSRGAVYVYHGSSAGIGATSAATLYGEASTDYFGETLDGAGDIDRDGYDELVVGAYSAGSSGKAYVYAGSSAGISSVGVGTLSPGGATFGRSVAGVGDVNGDGFADVAIGDDWYGSQAGRVLVYRGSLGGLLTTPFASVTGAALEMLGTDVAAAGDVDGDGFDDVIAGAPEADSDLGAAYLFEGSASTITRATKLPGLSDDLLGTAVASAGDVNADGYDDVIVGAPGYDNGAGRAYVYLGSAAGLPTTAATTVTGTADEIGLGSAVAGGCDVNGDGYDDVLIGAPVASAYGAVYVHHGSASGVPATPTTTLVGAPSAYPFGTGVACADLNGDGLGDVIATAPTSHAVRTFHGRPAGLSTGPTRSLTAMFAESVARVGDVNGDGYEDVAIGAASYDEDRGHVWLHTGSSAGVSGAAVTELSGYNVDDHFGHALAGADVNGDGFDDLIVGAYGYSGDRGRAYVYQGAATGFSGTLVAVISGGATGDRFGSALAGLGDLDGDGYEDVAIAADGVDSLGAVYVHHGSATSLGSTAGSTLATRATVLANAGDIDGDGAVDLLTGLADHDADAGLVSVYGTYADADEDGVSTGVDCDDADPSVGGPDTAYADTDGDGFGDVAAPVATCTATAGYVADATDCDDTSAAVHPGATEVCDAADADEDCDGLAEDADPGVTGRGIAYVDADRDGYGDPRASIAACDAGPGYSGVATDCDDGAAAVHPGATEVCDAADVDEDCDGLPDHADAGATGKTTVYTDADGDGHGRAPAAFCDAPGSGYVAAGDDCDDANAAVHPGAAEVCDAADADEDCDGLADDADADASGKTSFHADLDRDGFGGAATADFCDLPAGYAVAGTDCDDGAADVSPAATEVCDAADRDEDCDGRADDADAGTTGTSTFYRDADGDGYGGATTTAACDRPAGYAAVGTDCDDTSAAVHPGGSEVCDAADADEDCDGAADDADTDASGRTTVYVDADGDGFGSTTPTLVCDPGAGYAATADDCDDADATTFPGAVEGTGDARDQDCDGAETCYADADGDGFRGVTQVPSADLDCDDAGEAPADAVPDCDDADATVYGGAEEVVGDGADGDCDGVERCYVDADGDGFRPDETSTVASEDLDCDDAGEAGPDAPAGDCDDTSAAFHPGLEEPNCVDPNDYNCDGSVGYADADGDGFAACEECDDGRTAVHPDATETCNGRDDDCDGTIDVDAADEATWYADADGDGHGDPGASATACDAPEGYVEAATDCDDADATAHPGGDDVAGDGVDQDCDGADATPVDTGDTGDTAEPSDSGAPPDKDAAEGCACAAGTGSAGWIVAVGAAAVAVRRRRA